MHSIDIIIFALLAVFLILKLFSVLGQKNDISSSESKSNTFNSKFGKQIKTVEIINKKDLSPEQQIKTFDPSFSESVFLSKAQTAYEIILKAYADNNTQVISDLVDIKIMRTLAYNITKREEKKQKCTIDTFKHKEISLDKIEIKNSVAKIHISIESEIIFYVTDLSNKVIHGNKTKLQNLSQKLCFCRNIENNDPTWKIETLPTIPF